jgi:phage-related minor tail protein
LSSAFDSIFSPASGGSSGGPFGWLFSGLGSLASGGVAGRAKGGPVSAGKPYVVGERRAELFVPTTSGRIIPQVPTMPDLSGVSSGAQAIHVSFAPSYNVTGNGEDIASLRRQMARDRAEFGSRAVAEIQKAQKRGVKV